LKDELTWGRVPVGSEREEERMEYNDLLETIRARHLWKGLTRRREGRDTKVVTGGETFRTEDL